MLDTNTFTHSGENGPFADSRMRDAGYNFSGTWEWADNLASTGTTGVINLEEAIVRHYEGL